MRVQKRPRLEDKDELSEHLINMLTQPNENGETVTVLFLGTVRISSSLEGLQGSTHSFFTSNKQWFRNTNKQYIAIPPLPIECDWTSLVNEGTVITGKWETGERVRYRWEKDRGKNIQKRERQKGRGRTRIIIIEESKLLLPKKVVGKTFEILSLWEIQSTSSVDPLTCSSEEVFLT